jgi:nucleoside 2-deoxyribosyltransferase
MRIWLAYKFRGRDKKELKLQLLSLSSMLRMRGHEVITMAGDIQRWSFGVNPMTKSEVVRRAVEEMRRCDAILCLVEKDEPSEGRGWEAGFCFALGKPTILAVHKSVSNPYNEALYTENPANAAAGLPSVIRWETLEHVADALRTK